MTARLEDRGEMEAGKGESSLDFLLQMEAGNKKLSTDFESENK